MMACCALWLGTGCAPSAHPPPSPRATTLAHAMRAPDKVLDLDLYYRRLTNFPPAILVLTNLEQLNLRTCQIGELPDGIAGLTKLQHFDCGQAGLTNLTPSVGSLSRLTRLWLNDNHLTALPDLARLVNLEYLNLDRNRLTVLPDSLGALPSLRWLRLNNNRLTSLPHDLSGLSKSLEVLYLMNNPIPTGEQDRIRQALPKCRVIFR